MDDDSSNSGGTPYKQDEESGSSNSDEAQQSRNPQANESGDEEAKFGEKMDIDLSAEIDALHEHKKGKKELQPRQVKEITDYLCAVKTVKKNLLPFAKLVGHTSSVEDVIFKPNSAHELCSVGIDKKILFWDTRVKNARGDNFLSQQSIKE